MLILVSVSLLYTLLNSVRFVEKNAAKLLTKTRLKGDTVLNLSPPSSVSLSGFSQCTASQILKGNNVGTKVLEFVAKENWQASILQFFM